MFGWKSKKPSAAEDAADVRPEAAPGAASEGTELRGQSQAPDEIYTTFPTEVLPLNSEEAVLYNRRTRKIKVLPAYSAEPYRRLGEWRTREDHLRFLSASLGRIDRQYVEPIFDELLAEGFLLSGAELLERLKSRKTKGPEPAKVTAFLWPTAGRPELLGRSVEGFARNFQRCGRNPRLLVLDDSETAQDREATKKALASLSDRLASEGCPRPGYVGREEKAAFLSRLGPALDAAGVDPAVLDFAVNRPEGVFGDGAVRNLGLLLTAGEAFVSTDDDMECSFALPEGGTGKGLEIASVNDPQDFRAFTDRAELLKAIQFSSPDFLAEHERFLGASLSSLVSGFKRSEVRLDRGDAVFAERLFTAGGRAVATSFGVAGDSGMATSRLVLTLTGRARDLTFGEVHYPKRRLFREVLRLAPRPSCTRGSHFMSGHYGLDNRGCPPPFIPRYRNADAVFGRLLTFLHGDGLIAHLPLAIFHNPEPGRTVDEGTLKTWGPGTADLVFLLASSCAVPPGATGPENRLDVLAKHFRSLADLPREDFLGYVKGLYLPHLTDYIASMDQLLAAYGSKPDEWAEDVLAQLAYIEDHVTDEDFFFPSDMKKDATGGDPIARFIDLLGKYAELLEAWPFIWEAAREANGRG